MSMDNDWVWVDGLAVAGTVSHRWGRHPLLPVSGTGTGFDSSPIKGEGYEVGVVLFILWMLDLVLHDSPTL